MTALTAQNPREVRGIVPVEPAFVVLQAQTVAAHERIAAVKTGMLASAAIVDAVADLLREWSLAPEPPTLVVDPVLVATSGARLLSEDAMVSLTRNLLPLADILTPNLLEAAALLGRSPESALGWTRAEQADAALRIVDLGARAVLVKGGHRSDSAADVLAMGHEIIWLDGPRIPVRSTHGSGCTLAAAIAAGLAWRRGLLEAVTDAKKHVTRVLSVDLREPTD